MTYVQQCQNGIFKKTCQQQQYHIQLCGPPLDDYTHWKYGESPNTRCRKTRFAALLLLNLKTGTVCKC